LEVKFRITNKLHNITLGGVLVRMKYF